MHVTGVLVERNMSVSVPHSAIMRKEACTFLIIMHSLDLPSKTVAYILLPERQDILCVREKGNLLLQRVVPLAAALAFHQLYFSSSSPFPLFACCHYDYQPPARRSSSHSALSLSRPFLSERCIRPSVVPALHCMREKERAALHWKLFNRTVPSSPHCSLCVSRVTFPLSFRPQTRIDVFFQGTKTTPSRPSSLQLINLHSVIPFSLHARRGRRRSRHASWCTVCAPAAAVPFPDFA